MHSFPTEICSNIFKYLPLRDLLNCEETCHELDEVITFLFYHQREETGKIFGKDKHFFSNKGHFDDFKTHILTNNFFKQHWFMEELGECTHKFSEELKNICLENPPKELKDLHPVFEEDIFPLFEEHGFSALLAQKVAASILRNQPHVIRNACTFIVKCHAVHIPLMHEMYNALFTRIVQLNTMTLDALPKNLSESEIKIVQGELQRTKNGLDHFNPQMILENNDFKELRLIDLTLQAIESGKLPGARLTKPHIPLIEKIATELFCTCNAAFIKLSKQFEAYSI